MADKHMKQVTVVVPIAVTMEVPVDLTNSEIEALVKYDTNWDVNCDNTNVNIVEVSDALEVTSIVEAPIV